ncbi:MAG TPA: DNA polymerase III subunit delta [Candidatus Saccharimonadales bacterium]|nr:DNA polymerase III subunit delta [Candidatus Saccharimonadales bacterium]
MVITLTGSNYYLLKRRLDELVAGFVEEHGELALERIDAEDARPRAVLDAVQSLPFLASRKMVVVRGAGANKEISGQIEQIIDSAGDSTDVIIYEPAADKRSSYFKVLKSKTQLEEFGQADARALAGWLVQEAQNLGGRLSLTDANYLVERVGADQQQLAGELEKLVIYEPGISRENIDLLTEKTPQSKVFDLLDAAFGGNKKKALQLYEEQRAQKVEPQAIMAMIAWQLKLLALAKLGEGKSAQQISRDGGVHPWPVQKAQNLARKIDGRRLREMAAEAVAIDDKSKTSRIDLDEALKTYIITL